MLLARWSEASRLASLRLFITLKNPVAACFCSSVRPLSHKVNSYNVRNIFLTTGNEYRQEIGKETSNMCGYHFIHIGRIEIGTRWFSHWKCCSIFKTLPASNGFRCSRKQLYSWICRTQECLIFIKRRPADKSRNINLLDQSLLIFMRLTQQYVTKYVQDNISCNFN